MAFELSGSSLYPSHLKKNVCCLKYDSMSAPTDQALLAAEANDDAALVDTAPTAPAEVQLDQVDESSDIERPSVHTESDPDPEAQAKPNILRKLSCIFSGSSGNSIIDDHSDRSSDTIYSLPFRPRPAPDLAATQQLACQRILQSSGFDTTQLPPVEPVAATPRPKNRHARKQRDSPESSETGAAKTPRARQRRRSSVAENKINLAEQALEASYEGFWTPSSLGLLESWYNKCIQASKEHLEAAIATRRKHVRVAFPSIVVGAGATGLAFFSVGDECDETSAGRVESTAISVSLAVLTSALSVLGGLTALFSLSERMSLHTAASSNYQNLARKIQLTLFLPVNLRSNVEVVLTDVSSEYNNIYDTSPLLFSGW